MYTYITCWKKWSTDIGQMLMFHFREVFKYIMFFIDYKLWLYMMLSKDKYNFYVHFGDYFMLSMFKFW